MENDTFWRLVVRILKEIPLDSEGQPYMTATPKTHYKWESVIKFIFAAVASFTLNGAVSFGVARPVYYAIVGANTKLFSAVRIILILASVWLVINLVLSTLLVTVRQPPIALGHLFGGLSGGLLPLVMMAVIWLLTLVMMAVTWLLSGLWSAFWNGLLLLACLIFGC